MHNQAENEPCYLLHRRAYKESSFLLDVFSLNHGRLSLLAKGALSSRKNTSAALLQPFQPLVLDWKGKSSLKTLTQIDAPSSALKLNNESLYCAYYLNELLIYLLPEAEANQAIFAWYSEALERLDKKVPAQTVLRHIEYCVLAELGLIPDFSMDSESQPIISDCIYAYFPGSGFVSDPDFQIRSLHCHGKTLKAFVDNYFAAGNDMDTLSDAELLKQAKSMMRFFVDLALNGRELKSRIMYADLKRTTLK